MIHITITLSGHKMFIFMKQTSRGFRLFFTLRIPSSFTSADSLRYKGSERV